MLMCLICILPSIGLNHRISKTIIPTSMASNLNLVFGSMTIGGKGHEQARVTDLEVAGRMLDAFTSRGYKELDTARIYSLGTCEEILAKLDWKSHGIIMDTKLFPTASLVPKGPWRFTHQKEEIRRGLLDSLKALETDKVDMFYLHGPDRTTPFEETLEAVNELYKEGRFNRFGISNYMAWEVVQMCEICDKNGWIKPTVYQGMYNAFARMSEAELFPCLRKYGLAFYVFNPLGGGFLTDKFHRKDQEAETGSRYDSKHMHGKWMRERYWNDYMFEALEMLREAAKKHGLTESECALRWLTNHSPLKKENGDAVIVGASSLAQLEGNLDDLEKGPLPDDVVEALDAGWAKIRGGYFNYFV